MRANGVGSKGLQRLGAASFCSLIDGLGAADAAGAVGRGPAVASRM